MARIKLNLKSLSVTDKIAKGQQIVTAMTNNASFPNPNPPLPEAPPEQRTSTRRKRLFRQSLLNS